VDNSYHPEPPRGGNREPCDRVDFAVRAARGNREGPRRPRWSTHSESPRFFAIGAGGRDGCEPVRWTPYSGNGGAQNDLEGAPLQNGDIAAGRGTHKADRTPPRGLLSSRQQVPAVVGASPLRDIAVLSPSSVGPKAGTPSRRCHPTAPPLRAPRDAREGARPTSGSEASTGSARTVG